MSDKILGKVKYFMGLDSNDESTNDQGIDIVNDKEEKKVKIFPEKRAETLSGKNKINPKPKVDFMDNRDENKINVTIIKPENFDVSAVIVNNLKAQKPVIVNLELLEADIARKIFDFCSGALFALDGKIFKVSKNIFLFAPENVYISGNIKDAVENNYDME